MAILGPAADGRLSKEMGELLPFISLKEARRPSWVVSKTKNVDVVMNKPGLGSVLPVSCKGMTGAFCNLTNRMEETIGECTNLHIAYQAMVSGYCFVIRANRLVEEAAAIACEEDPPPAKQL